MNPFDITSQQRSRLACVYVRQSTRHQVLNHRESQRRQRALVERPALLGWPQNRIKLIDDDLALSAEGGRRRPSFEALVADVAMGMIGLIVGSEVSRLSRANRHWYYLLDICAVTRTIIADEEGLYDPRIFNDRLVLGMKRPLSYGTSFTFCSGPFVFRISSPTPWYE
jgi:DNA invertase Pin-like site-specific DNA recombinase